MFDEISHKIYKRLKDDLGNEYRLRHIINEETEIRSLINALLIHWQFWISKDKKTFDKLCDNPMMTEWSYIMARTIVSSVNSTDPKDLRTHIAPIIIELCKLDNRIKENILDNEDV